MRGLPDLFLNRTRPIASDHQRHSDVDTPALADLRAVISMFVAYIPLIGTVAGIKGAIDAWGWGFWSSVAFFFWQFVIYALAFAVGGVAALMSRLSGK